MNSLQNLIQRCHKRREKPLRQKKTLVSPAIYKGLFYHFTVFCAYRYPIRLHDLEQAAISFMPIGQAPELDRVPQSYGGNRFDTRQTRTDWEIRLWHTSWGLHVYTGIPSQYDDARWHDLNFSYQAISSAPDAVLTCIQVLCNSVENPLLVITKSGGLRFSCRVPNYLHTNTEAARLYIYKDIPTSENRYQRDIYLEVLGEAGHSAWDARYEIVTGDLLDPPIISKEFLFTAIDALREKLHDPSVLETEKVQPYTYPVVISPPSLGSIKLNLAKEAFMKRGFTYIKQEDNYHYWKTQQGNEQVLLWEQDDNVWIRAETSNLGLPIQDTPITHVWDDTGILPSIPEAGLLVDEKIQAIREGKLSPLGIRRPSSVLEKRDDTKRVYEALDNNIEQIQSVFDNEARIIGFTGETQDKNNYEVEKHFLNTGPVAFSATFLAIEEMAGHFQKHNLPSIARWRHVGYKWDQVKDIPIDERMSSPFQQGNVCEDADRFLALLNKGMTPTENLCPKCQFYTDCKENGYLSQPATLQSANTQLFGNELTFLHPNKLVMSEKTLEPLNGKERLCIVDEVNIGHLFLGHSIPKSQLEEWCTNWKGFALGNFAQALRKVLEMKTGQDDLMVNRIRTAMQAFQPHEQEIIEQMCLIIGKGKVIARGFNDEQTGEQLARFAIEFIGGASAYIPLDNNAADRLNALQIPVLQPNSFETNTDINIPMSIEQAIRFGILDITSVEHIQTFPVIYENPDWTFWHQLKRHLAHYKRDADAPIVWHRDKLEYWVPPVLHPNIKRLLLMSTTLSETDVRRGFPNEKMDVIRINPTPWVEGNTLFQIQTGVHSLKTVLDYDSTWDVVGLSKLGRRIFLSICAEIERNSNVKHAIITYQPIIKQLEGVAKKENVCLITEFKALNNLDTALETLDVVWIVGTPSWDPAAIWLRAQIVYGNDEEPLCYETDSEFQHYKDERLQRIYIQNVANLIANIVGRVGMNRLANKKVVLISSLEIPSITDRPQTILFDWEDFEIAGSLDKLAETIKTRHQYEKDRENITAETSREEVERILGCVPRSANRILQNLRGGNIPRVTFREQILTHLADGEKKVSELVEVIEGNQKGIHNELTRLTKNGEIIKVRRGVYALPE